MKQPQIFTGEYSYRSALPAVPFSFTLAPSLCGGFRGRIIDDPELGVPFPACVRGRIKQGRMAFRKDYRGAPFTIRSEAGRESFDDYVARRFGAHPSLSLHHPTIFYFARITDEGRRVEGHWTILPKIVPLKDGRVLLLPRSRGQFHLDAKKS